MAFLDRLYTAKRKVEERIVILGGEDESVRNVLAMYNDLLTLILAKSNNFSRAKRQVWDSVARHPQEP